jgi:hypothetical protein
MRSAWRSCAVLDIVARWKDVTERIRLARE